MEPKLDNYFLDEISGRIMMESDGGPVATQYRLENNRIVDPNGNPSTFRLDAKGRVRNSADARAIDKDINRITADCLTATGHEATYREILSKAMAEPLAHRCKYAIQLHFHSWCRNHGVEYPIGSKQLSELYGLDIADFHEELMKIIRKGKIDYPLHDADRLLAIGEDGKDPPLAICCQATNVSLDVLMDMLFQ